MIEAPLIILGSPRSGTTVLQRCLSVHPDLWHLPAESHRILEGPFHPARSGYESNRVTADAVSDDLAERLRWAFRAGAINLNRTLRDPAPLLGGSRLSARVANKAAVLGLGVVSRIRKPASIRFLEKTPKNSLRVPMLLRVFPDARFLCIRRDPESNVLSLLRGWHAVDRIGPIRRPRFSTGYPVARELRLEDYREAWWKFTLVPGWRALKGMRVADVAAWQYYQCNRYMLSDLAALEPARVFALRYEEFVRAPAETMARVLDWAGLAPDRRVDAFARNLPRVNRVDSASNDGGRSDRAEVVAALDRLPAARELAEQSMYPTDVAP